MATTNHNNSEEIELGVLFKGIKRFFKKILILIYRFIQFLIRSWIVILILILLGAIAGYFLQDEKSEKQSTLIVRANFNSTSFLYESVEQLENSSATEGSIKDSLGILEIEIEPIVNISDLLDEFENDRNAVVNLLEDFQAEEGPFSHKAFIHQYRFHEIKIVFNSDANIQNIEMLIEYLKSNSLLENIKNIALRNLEQRLLDNEKIIEQINNILSSISNSEGFTANGLVVLGNSSNLHDVLEFKKELLEENDKIRENILTQQELVVLINKPKLIKAGSLFNNKVLMLPLLLVLSYITIFILRNIYRKMGTLAATP